jgi:hypothetical protein
LSIEPYRRGQRYSRAAERGLNLKKAESEAAGRSVLTSEGASPMRADKRPQGAC